MHGDETRPSPVRDPNGKRVAVDLAGRAADVEVIKAGRNKVTVKIGAGDPAKPIALAFPRPWFNGYEATLNGKPVPTRPYLKFIPLVELPPGSTGIVELRYWPMFLRLGLPLAGGSALVLLLAAIISITLRKR